VKLAVCIVSPPGYVHSEAFREVAQTLESAARSLGHDAIVTDRADLPGRRAIVLGSNLLARHPIPLPTDSVLYNLEQAGPGPWFEPAALEILRRFRVWDYSEHNAANLVALGVPRPRVVPVGFVPELARIESLPEEIDVLFYGSLNERRQAVLDELTAAGARVESVFGVYGKERDRLIARSRMVLNVHFFEAKVFEIVRVSYLLANGRAVVCERGASPEEEAPFEEGVAFADHAHLARTCLDLLQSPAECARLAGAGRQIMESRPAASYLRPALAELA